VRRVCDGGFLGTGPTEVPRDGPIVEIPLKNLHEGMWMHERAMTKEGVRAKRPPSR
jgi:hypothetical protein